MEPEGEKGTESAKGQANGGAKKEPKERTEKQRAADAKNLKAAHRSQEEVKLASEEEAKIVCRVPEEDGASENLQALRHVHMNPKKFDRTEEQKTARKIKDRDPSKFLTTLTQAENDHKKGKEAGVAVEDVGTDRCVALCEEWLRDFVSRSR